MLLRGIKHWEETRKLTFGVTSLFCVFVCVCVYIYIYIYIYKNDDGTWYRYIRAEEFPDKCPFYRSVILDIFLSYVNILWNSEQRFHVLLTVHLSIFIWYHHSYRCDDTRGCVMQFWPPDDEHMCSKHVEAWNKTCETNFVH